MSPQSIIATIEREYHESAATLFPRLLKKHRGSIRRVAEELGLSMADLRAWVNHNANADIRVGKAR